MDPSPSTAGNARGPERRHVSECQELRQQAQELLTDYQSVEDAPMNLGVKSDELHRLAHKAMELMPALLDSMDELERLQFEVEQLESYITDLEDTIIELEICE